METFFIVKGRNEWQMNAALELFYTFAKFGMLPPHCEISMITQKSNVSLIKVIWL